MTNKERFEIKDERHFARIESYRERLEKGVDLFTGEPLRGEDLEGWKAAMSYRDAYESSPAVKRRVRANV
tara:strand:- start:4409 stop:4618 length:210 start_codon:yes stop_codon:yes gene_type:complete